MSRMPLSPHSSIYRPTGGLEAGSMEDDHRPPPIVQGSWALAIKLSHATRLRYLPSVMHAAYVAKDKDVVG